ncbi:glutathione peroxidase [Rhodovibrio salinarum]|uniref:Glutathione peroxidase n=1 Tax=Rhodovibrio salinarum TaxID=1087 RepID=A0A934QG50_9PROT|nr:glutathione peroxidase [Rhodovibrio salinarum]MBK1695915.1 glutathione peroxidase [Rhodovibrio salinarum]
MSAHDFTFPALEGGDINLAIFANRALLLVNTASACGYAGQFTELQQLYDDLGERGLMVIAVPSNDFGEQEPLSEGEIAQHYRNELGLTFPITGKQQVVGAGAHRFYHWVHEEAGEAAAPRWNFHKVLLDPQGELAGVWPSSVSPQDAEVRAAIEAVLPG